MPVFVRTIALGVGLLGAATTSQLPEYAQQYTQRLGGAVDELAAFVRDFDRDAQTFGLERQIALQRMLRNTDDFIRDRGESARQTIERFDRLGAHYTAMREAPPLQRLWLMRSADGSIARRAFDDFKPAVPLTVDGAVAAAVGFVIGLLVVFGLSRSAKTLRRRADKKTIPFEPMSSRPR
jgi:hypothetical protein